MCPLLIEAAAPRNTQNSLYTTNEEKLRQKRVADLESLQIKTSCFLLEARSFLTARRRDVFWDVWKIMIIRLFLSFGDITMTSRKRYSSRVGLFQVGMIFQIWRITTGHTSLCLRTHVRVLVLMILFPMEREGS